MALPSNTERGSNNSLHHSWEIGQTRVEIAQAPAGLERAITLLFTKECLEFLVKLVDTFDEKAEKVLQERVLRRQLGGKTTPNFAVAPNQVDSWIVDPIPKRLVNRKLDLGDISPADTELFVAALKSDAQGVQVDFDDGHCPSWKNQLTGWLNVFLAVRNQLAGIAWPSLEKAPVLMLRPRAWNMVEHNVTINGREIPGPLMDFGVLMFHGGQIMAECDSGPYFYLSKLEAALEARLWDEIFTWTEGQLGLTFGTIKSCVLIENILAAFEMELILYELRHHCFGLNGGVLDYSASIISVFGGRPDFIIADRVRFVNMDQPFLQSYMQLLVRVCHKRRALATGGMAAKLLEGDDDDATKQQVIQQVLQAKSKEIRLGLDGFLVYDLGLVPHLNKLWDEHCHTDNQLEVELPTFEVSAADLLRVPVGHASLASLEHNIAVTILFIEAWLRGKGTFPFRGSIEDSATAEISRWQIWQWIHHEVTLGGTGGQIVTRPFVLDLADSASRDALESSSEDRLALAISIFNELVNKEEPPVFITTFLSDRLLL